jgi:hypothetical protein
MNTALLGNEDRFTVTRKIVIQDKQAQWIMNTIAPSPLTIYPQLSAGVR